MEFGLKAISDAFFGHLIPSLHSNWTQDFDDRHIPKSYVISNILLYKAQGLQGQCQQPSRIGTDRGETKKQCPFPSVQSDCSAGGILLWQQGQDEDVTAQKYWL